MQSSSSETGHLFRKFKSSGIIPDEELVCIFSPSLNEYFLIRAGALCILSNMLYGLAESMYIEDSLSTKNIIPFSDIYTFDEDKITEYFKGSSISLDYEHYITLKRSLNFYSFIEKYYYIYYFSVDDKRINKDEELNETYIHWKSSEITQEEGDLIYHLIGEKGKYPKNFPSYLLENYIEFKMVINSLNFLECKPVLNLLAKTFAQNLKGLKLEDFERLNATLKKLEGN